MSRQIVGSLVLLFSFFGIQTFVQASAITDRAQTAWDQRDHPGSTEKAVGLWEQAVKDNPQDTTLWIALTKASARATRHAGTSSERKRWADKSRTYGEKAVATNPQNPDAYKFYGEALGQWANAHKGVSGLKVVKEAVAAINKCLEINPHDGYAHMLLAEFYRQAPSVISVGDKAKSLEQAKLAVQYGGDHAITHLALARILIDLNRKPEAIAQLQTVLTLPPPADAIPETHADQGTARDLLKSLGVQPDASTTPAKTWTPPSATGTCSETSPAFPGGTCQSTASH